MPGPPPGAIGPIAVTMGEPAGVGGEIALKAWLTRTSQTPVFFAIDDPARLTALAARLGLAVPVAIIARADAAPARFAHALPVLPVPGCPLPVVEPGRPRIDTAAAVVRAIDAAVALVRGGEAAAMVTSPINKKILQDDGFGFPGHTEYLGHISDAAPVMMLAVERADPPLRVVPVTVHLPLRQVAAALSTDAIIAAGRVTAAALRTDFAIAAPRLAVAALNPHAGEDGKIGDEEPRLIEPAVAALRAEGIDAVGPAPADTLFHADARRGIDAVICMYHDQALVPLKTLDFWGGVNVTLGLPFVRTSPDHGTAFDIAGRGIARPDSLIAAIDLAARIAAARIAAARTARSA
ncbi:MAG: 4-hydroxythreonine-4-phosphate dehydrogenase PdxA [Rhodospirillaceae bacterium]|nr:4-hydroxythreonine-4-phosphate dehydrogenase PdxA [Rhodospirillaceae bacterium]